MKLLLALETSSDQTHVVLGRDGDVIFDSATDEACRSPRSIAELVSCGLKVVNAPASDIAGLAINIGPGGLTHIRAGVSFVNALAFSLGVDIYPFNWFEIVAQQTQRLTSLPVLGVVPAANDQAYVGMIKGASVTAMRFGPLLTAVAEVSDGLPEIAVAGRIRERLSSLLNGTKVTDTGIDRPDAAVLLELGYGALERSDSSAGQVSPLNDQSEIFYARA